MWRSSLAVAALLLLSTRARAGEVHYTVEDGKIVVENDGIFESIDVDCEHALELVEHAGKLFVACGAQGIAVYALADPMRPVLADRVEGACDRLASDGTCVAFETERARFTSTASAAAIAAAACELRPRPVRGHPFIVYVAGDGPCSTATPPDDASGSMMFWKRAISLVVRTERQGASQTVVLEAELPEGVPVEEFRAALTQAGRELQRRVEGSTPARPTVSRPDFVPLPLIWYGKQTMIADAISLAPLLVDVGLAYVPDLCTCRGVHVVDTLAVAGGFSYGLGAPIIHWAHGRVERGFTSLGIRAGAGLIAGYAAGVPTHYSMSYAYGGSTSYTTGPDGLALAGTVLAVAALLTPPILDAFVFSYMPAPQPPPRAQIVPLVTASKNGAAFGVAGSF